MFKLANIWQVHLGYLYYDYDFYAIIYCRRVIIFSITIGNYIIVQKGVCNIYYHDGLLFIITKDEYTVYDKYMSVVGKY